MARSVSLHTVVLASLGSGSAALLAGQSGLTGTVVGAALVPVVVAAVTELGSRPLERMARLRRRADGEIAAPPPPAASGRGWERWAAGSAVALAVGALAVAVADGAERTQAPAATKVIVREIQTTTYAAVPVPEPRTVTIVQRVEVPVPMPDDGERPVEQDPATDAGADDGAAAPPPAGEEPDTTVAEPPTPPATETDAAVEGQVDPAAVKERLVLDA